MHAPKFLALLLGSAVGFALIATTTQADSLRYHPTSGSQVAYQFEISLDSDSQTTTLSGVTNYTINSVENDIIDLTFRGGLSESVKVKQSGGIRDRFGPGFGRPSFPSPFARPTFSGKTNTTNQISMTHQGTVLKLQGDSQLPYLLGNLSLLPFEPLMNSDQEKWQVESGVSITEKEEDRFGPPASFGHFGPFGNADKESYRAASQKTEFKIISQDNRFLTVRKTHRLVMPASSDSESITMSGEGQWVFNRELGVPESADFTYILIVNKGNVTVEQPIKLTFNRLSPQELAERDAVAKLAAEQRAAAAAKTKAEAETPLTAEEKREALASLRANDTAAQVTTLNQLARKSLEKPDPEIAAAIRPLVDSDNKSIQTAASNALKKWDFQYKKTAELKQQYDRAGAIDSSGLEVNSLTDLFVGQILQANQHGPFWNAASVVELLEDGRVKVQLRGGGRRELTLARRQLQLAPPELPQPARPQPNRLSKQPAVVKPASPNRTWTDATGSFQVEATLGEIHGNQIVLERADGRSVTLRIEKLSQADQEYVRKVQAESVKVKNPFEP